MAWNPQKLTKEEQLKQGAEAFTRYATGSLNTYQRGLEQLDFEVKDYMIKNDDFDILVYNEIKGNKKLSDKLAILALLFQYGADPNNIPGVTALLHMKDVLLVPEIVNALLFHGANPNIQGKTGTTPLLHAIWHDGIPRKTIDLLVFAGADETLVNKSNESPLDPSKSLARQYLMDALEFRPTLGDEHLVMAAKYNRYYEIVRFINQVRNVNVRDLVSGPYITGNTALHYSVHNNNLKIAQLLLEHGADPSVKNTEKMQPSEYTTEDTAMYALLAKFSTQFKTMPTVAAARSSTQITSETSEVCRKDKRGNLIESTEHLLRAAEELGLNRRDLVGLKPKEICSRMTEHLRRIQGPGIPRDQYNEMIRDAYSPEKK